MNTTSEHRGRNEVPASARKASGHTPGPWKAREYRNSDGDIWIDCGGWNAGGTLATAHKNGTGEGTVESNAKLIAAAPEMLATLQRIESLMTDLGAKGEPLKTVRAAIAKATGTS